MLAGLSEYQSMGWGPSPQGWDYRFTPICLGVLFICLFVFLCGVYVLNSGTCDTKAFYQHSPHTSLILPLMISSLTWKENIVDLYKREVWVFWVLKYLWLACCLNLIQNSLGGGKGRKPLPRLRWRGRRLHLSRSLHLELFHIAVNTRLALFWEFSDVSQVFIPVANTGVAIKVHTPIVSRLGILIKIRSLLGLDFWVRIARNGA